MTNVPSRGPGAPAALLLLCLVAALLYGPTLADDYLIDDGAMIHFARVVGLSDAQRMSNALATVYWRPLPRLLLALDVAVWGTNAFGPRLTNLALLVLLGMAARRLAASAGLGRGPALGVGLLAVANPFAAAAATWIMARYDLLAALFALLALDAAVRHARANERRSIRGPLLGSVWTALALLCKELALVLPGLALLAAISMRPAGARRLGAATLPPALAASVAVLAVVGLRLALFGRIERAMDDPGIIIALRAFKSLLLDLPHIFLAPLNFGMFAPRALVWMAWLFLLVCCVLAALAFINNRGRGRIGLLTIALAALPSALYATYGQEGQCFYRLTLPAALLGLWAVQRSATATRGRRLGQAALLLLAGLLSVAGQAQARAQSLAAEQMQDVRQTVLRQCADPTTLDELIVCNLPLMLHGMPLAFGDLRGYFLPLWGERAPRMFSCGSETKCAAQADLHQALARDRVLALCWQERPGRLVDGTPRLRAQAADNPVGEIAPCSAAVCGDRPVYSD